MTAILTPGSSSGIMTPTVLITSAISPPVNTPALRMTDSGMRAMTTKAAIFFWAGQGPKNMVICDSTGSDVLTSEELSAIRKLGVGIEQITFKQDDALVVERGKGFAEGKLIEFAVQKSELLNKSGHFFKCTGKLYCRNFQRIWDLIVKNNIGNMFWKLHEHSLVDRNLVDARFFYTSVADFHRLISAAYSRATEYQILEHQLSLSLHSQLNAGASLRPQLSGFSGGLGTQWEEHNLGDLDSSYPCWYSLRR
jgi:hypothetical protein